MSELKNEMDLSQIRYSMVWEDELLLRKNLSLTDKSRVLSIGSAGCNCFNLLLDNPEELHIVDMSPAQMALIRLKIAAIKSFKSEQFLQFFGYQPSPNRDSLFAKLEHLSPEDRSYWKSQWALIENGLCHQGRLEKFFQYFREKYLHQIWPAEFRRSLLQTTTLKKQIDLIESSGTKDLLEKAASEFFGRQGLEQGRDPAQMKYVTQKDIGQRFYRLFEERLHETLIAQNFFLYYFIEGTFPGDEKVLPSYLQATNYQRLPGLLNRIHLHEADIQELLGKSKPFSAFNLSDIFEYMSEFQAGAMMQSLATGATKDARMAYWTLLVDRKPMKPWISTTTQGRDRLWFYEDFYLCQKE